jgi:ribonuclease Z
MLMQDACKLAKNAEVSRLWLTHYSPAEKNPQIYLEEMQKIFSNTKIFPDGVLTNSETCVII